MAKQTVEKYQLAWQHSAKKGSIVLLFPGGGGKQINGLDADDFLVMSELLRNEKPMWYDENQSLLATTHEPIGEAE